MRPPKIFTADATVPAPEAVQLTVIELKTFHAEYAVRPPNLIIHLYRYRDGSNWTYEDAQTIWDVLIKTFGLEGRENRLTVEFIPEFYSWCITVEKIAVIAPPSHERIVEALTEIEEKKVNV